MTTLADDGPGSLRSACTADGPRTVVFRVGGAIRLKSHLRVTKPFITIAGQTAPGDGILLRDAGLAIETHDAVVRFLRVRVGAGTVEPYDTQDALHVGDGSTNVYNVVVDHCSFSWSIDECASVVGPSRDVTISNCIIAEALREPLELDKERSHSMGLLLGNTPDRVLVTRCLLAHCDSRNPRIQGGRHAFVNNVVYDWRYMSGTLSRDPEVNFVGNVYIPGGPSRDIPPISDKVGAMGKVYVRDNFSPYGADEDLAEWDRTVAGPADDHRADEAFEFAMPAILPVGEVEEQILRDVGATSPRRDEVDRRVVRHVRLRMGTSIDRPEEVGGFPEMYGGDSPIDGNHDRIADMWERENALDSEDPADGAADHDGDGWTNVEEYLESLIRIERPAPPRVLTEGDPDPDAPWKVRYVGPDGSGFPLHVERLGDESETWMCRLTTAREGEVEVAWTGDAVGELGIHPHWFEPRSKRKGNAVVLRIQEPGMRLVRVAPSSAERVPILLVIVERSEPRPVRGPNVIDLHDSAELRTADDPTPAIQSALDRCAEAGGGSVILPRGRFRVAGVKIPSETTLVLSEGTVLRARPGAKRPVVLMEGVMNSGLRGPGRLVLIDEAPPWTGICIANSSGVTISDVLCQGMGERPIVLVWADASSCLALENVSVVRGQRGTPRPAAWDTCVTIRGSTGVRLVGCGFFGAVASLDAVSIPAVPNTEAIRVNDVFSAGAATGLVFEADGGTIQHCGVQDGEIRGLRGVIIRGLGGRETSASVDDFTLRDVRMIQRPVECWEPEHSDSFPPTSAFAVLSADGCETRRLLFDRVRIESALPCVFRAEDSGTIRDVNFWGVEFVPQMPPENAPVQPLVTLEGVEDAGFRLIRIDWSRTDRSKWKGLLESKNCTSIDVREVEELGSGSHPDSGLPPADR